MQAAADDAPGGFFRFIHVGNGIVCFHDLFLFMNVRFIMSIYWCAKLIVAIG
jgi:hypothetical protein